MVTIRRHPVPANSYDPDRPLNDLLLAQLDHFKHIAEALPADARAKIPAFPPLDDRAAVDRFIAAVTQLHVGRKQLRPQLVRSKPRPQPGTIAIAAVAEEKPTRKKSKAPNKPAVAAGPEQ